MDSYIEQLIERGKKAHVKRGYFVYHIESGKWLGRVKSHYQDWFLSDEPLQTFTINSLSQVLYAKADFWGHRLSQYDWVLIEV